MKKATCTLIMLLSTALCSTGMASDAASGALPPLELSPNCAYVFNPFTSTPRGFDALSEQLISVIRMMGIEIPVATWQEADLEMVGGEAAVGDGIPDYYQLAMLGAALCAGDPTILSQFEANIAQFDDQVAQLLAMLSAFMALPPIYDPALTALDTWIAELPVDGYAWYQAENLSWALHDTEDGISSGVAPYATILNTMLPMYANWFAAMGGLNSGLRSTLNHLLAGLIDDYTSSCAMKATSQGRFSYTTWLIEDLMANTDPPMPAELADLCMNVKNQLNNVVLPQIFSLHLPDMVIFGLPKSHIGNKTSSEPFAADGDYNGDGITNKQAYDLVTAAGGDRFTFVRAAAGNSPFWTGNTALPVTGLIGLAILACACAAAGTFSTRRK